MKLIFSLPLDLTAHLDREGYPDVVRDAMESHLDVHHGRVTRLTPATEWLFENVDGTGEKTGAYLIVHRGSQLDVFSMYSWIRLDASWEAALDAGAASPDLLRHLAGGGIPLSASTSVVRRASRHRRSLVERVRGTELASRPNWLLTDPESGQTLVAWKIDQEIVAFRVTFSNESPVLWHHQIFWNGRYELQRKEDAHPERFLSDGIGRMGLKDEKQRRKWDYFFPPLPDRLVLNRLVWRREVSAREGRRHATLERALSGVMLLVGAGLAFLGSSPVVAGVLGLLCLASFMPALLDRLLPGYVRQEAGTRRGKVADRLLAFTPDGLALRTRSLTTRYLTADPAQPAPRPLDEVLRELRALRRFAPLLPPAAVLCAGLVLLRDGVTAGQMAAMLLGLAAMRNEVSRWEELRWTQRGFERRGNLPPWVLAAAPLAAALLSPALFPLPLFAAVAASRLVRASALHRLAAELERERDYLEWERDHLLEQLPSNPPTDGEIDELLDEETKVLDDRAFRELHIDPAQLQPIVGRQLGRIDLGAVGELDAHVVPASLLRLIEDSGATLGPAHMRVTESGRQWLLSDGAVAYTVTRKDGALHVYEDGDPNPLGLKGVLIRGWGLVQPRSVGKDRLMQEHPEWVYAWKVGRDGKLRHAVYYVQLLYFADNLLAASGFFYNFIEGLQRGKQRAENMEYPYRNIVGVQDQPERNDGLREIASGKDVLETTLFQLKIVNGESIRIALTDEQVLKLMKDNLRRRDRRTHGDDGTTEQPEGAALPGAYANAHSRSLLDAEDGFSDAALSKTVINYVKRQWRDRRTREGA